MLRISNLTILMIINNNKCRVLHLHKIQGLSIIYPLCINKGITTITVVNRWYNMICTTTVTTIQPTVDLLHIHRDILLVVFILITIVVTIMVVNMEAYHLVTLLDLEDIVKFGLLININISHLMRILRNLLRNRSMDFSCPSSTQAAVVEVILLSLSNQEFHRNLHPQDHHRHHRLHRHKHYFDKNSVNKKPKRERISSTSKEKIIIKEKLNVSVLSHWDR